MTRHIFLTGEKHIGKSTLVKKFLNGYKGTVGGFITVRTKDFLGDRYSVHLFCVGDKPIPGENNLLFICGEDDGNTEERFNAVWIGALNKTEGISLIVMDELGPKEADAELFRKKVLELIKGDVPILGVLQKPSDLYWPEIADSPNVKILEITESNRNNKETAEGITAVLSKPSL